VSDLQGGRPALGNRRPRRMESRVVPLGQLRRNPVELGVFDGETWPVSAERGPAGKVWLTCQCPDGRAEGWCRHRLDLLASDFGAVRGLDDASRRAFEQIVAGTPLGDAGLAAHRAIRAFDECLMVFDKRRPANVRGGHLGSFADLIADLAACTADVEDALGNLRRLLERA
jgi:hypothetical protein